MNKKDWFVKIFGAIVLICTLLLTWSCIRLSENSDRKISESDTISNNSVPQDPLGHISNEIAKEVSGKTTINQLFKELPRDSSIVQFEVMEANLYNNSKCIFHIKIPEPISENLIEAIAYDIKSNNLFCEPLFIFYHLKGMRIVDGAWATSHFEPNLLIEILGTPEEQEAKIERSTPDSFECDSKNFYSYKNYKSYVWEFVDANTNIGNGWGRFVTSTDDIRVSSYGNGYYKVDIYEYNTNHPDVSVSLKFSHKSGMYYYYRPCGDNEYLIEEKLRIVQCLGKMSDMAAGRYSSYVIYFIYDDDKTYSKKGIAYKLKG